MKARTKTKIFHIVLFVVMMIVGISMMLPFIWTLSSSFKLKRSIMGFPIQWIPRNPTFTNYVQLWTKVPFMTYYLNTIKVTVIVTVLQTIMSSMAAYAFAKLRFPGRDKIFLMYLATMMVPWHAIMIPQFTIITKLNLYDTHTAVILLQLFSAFGVFLMRQHMLNIPNELSEAARLDGAGELTIMSRIILPSCKPAIATLTVFTFTSIWNDYLGPMIYLNSDNKKTIQLGLASFKSQYSSEYGLIMAGTVCALIPIVIIYIFAQKYLIKGVAFSGVKG